MSSSSARGDELHLTITPYGHIEWRGRRARLEASGQIPPDFEWPQGMRYAHWSARGFHFLLRRCRPDGLLGPMGRWTNCDYWYLRRSIPRGLDERWTIHEPYRDLADILFEATRPAGALRINLSKVHADESVEKFEAGVVQVGKVGRGVKAR